MSIGKTMKKRRERIGMSQEELARIAGVTQAAICQYENGKTKPNVIVAMKIAKALRMTVEDMGKGD